VGLKCQSSHCSTGRRGLSEITAAVVEVRALGCRCDELHLLLRPFNGLFSTTTWVSRYQKGRTSLDLNEARDDEVSG